MKTVEELFSDEKVMYRAFKKSKNNRSYLMSSMLFDMNAIMRLKQISDAVLSGKYSVAGYTEFYVTRPKVRQIKACRFRDKVVQHVLCDNILAQELLRHTIKDNYAGQKGKGTGLARKRIVENLEMYYSEFGNEGYIYRGDIHQYYFNINHKIAKEAMHEIFPKDTHCLIDTFIDSTGDEVGIALGNQINTIVSCAYLHKMDLFITEGLGYKFYGRYADDFYFIDNDKEHLKQSIAKLKEFLDDLKLELNPKSQIIKISRGLSFLGFHYLISDEGCVQIRLANDKKREYRRKFNKMYNKVIKGELELEKLEKSYRSWRKYVSHATDSGIFRYYDSKIKELKT